MENMLQSKKELEAFFSAELVNFLAKIPDNPIDYDLDPQPMVYCHDLEGLLCHIAAERKVEVTHWAGPWARSCTIDPPTSRGE